MQPRSCWLLDRTTIGKGRWAKMESVAAAVRVSPPLSMVCVCREHHRCRGRGSAQLAHELRRAGGAMMSRLGDDPRLRRSRFMLVSPCLMRSDRGSPLQLESGVSCQEMKQTNMRVDRPLPRSGLGPTFCIIYVPRPSRSNTNPSPPPTTPARRPFSSTRSRPPSPRSRGATRPPS